MKKAATNRIEANTISEAIAEGVDQRPGRRRGDDVGGLGEEVVQARVAADLLQRGHVHHHGQRVDVDQRPAEAARPRRPPPAARKPFRNSASSMTAQHHHAGRRGWCAAARAGCRGSPRAMAVIMKVTEKNPRMSAPVLLLHPEVVLGVAGEEGLDGVEADEPAQDGEEDEEQALLPREHVLEVGQQLARQVPASENALPPPARAGAEARG